jgi:uncharacterized protein with LGFP repeats
MSAIDDKARQIPWIGRPVDAGAGSAEMDLGDGRGRVRDYEHASIYWTPQTGAFEVHGDIRIHYGRKGGHRGFLRYPVTDETGTPDGVGRFNHFEGGSIYWTPRTGAKEVHGAIREEWARMGWERSWLRYPVSDEQDMPGGRVSFSEGGKIEWTPSGGAKAVRTVRFDDD